jgi:hypothetical protein
MIFVSTVAGVLDVAAQAAQVVAGMKVVDPVVLRILAVVPGPVSPLPGATVIDRGVGSGHCGAVAGYPRRARE